MKSIIVRVFHFIFFITIKKSKRIVATLTITVMAYNINLYIKKEEYNHKKVRECKERLFFIQTTFNSRAYVKFLSVVEKQYLSLIYIYI